MPANTKKTVRKRVRRRPNTKPSVIFLYLTCLIAASVVLYSTLFVRAYSSLSNPGGTDPVANNLPGHNDHSSGSDPRYKTYPDTGKTVATVLIDAGHGGMDGGKPTPGGILEKDLNLTIANKVGKYLNELNPQIEVKYIRTDDNVFWGSVESEDLDYRLAQQRETNADYFVSLHCNSYDGDPSVEGTVFFINPDDPVARELSEDFRDNMTSIGWAENYQIIDYELLQLVSMSDIHSILIELGYMTNASDLARLTDEEMQNKVAKAIAAAISDYIMENPDAPEFVNPKFRNGKPLKKKEDSSAASSEVSSQISSQTPAEAPQSETADPAASQTDGTAADPNAQPPADTGTPADPNADPALTDPNTGLPLQ